MEYRVRRSSREASTKLDVYLHGEPVGTLAASEGGYEFAYARQAVARAGEGTTLLSRSLPLRAEPYGAAAARPYFEGLLPDGLRRERIARELGLDPADGLGLLAELGSDCPGAVLVLPEGERPEDPDPDALAWLGDDELEELLAAPPPRLFDPDNERRMRFALPGERHKLALVRDERSDRWAWPQPGMPSTHVVKPETGEYPDLVVNEVACTAALRRLGLPLAPLEPMRVAGRPCAVAARFDRRGDGLPATPRHHRADAGRDGVRTGAAAGGHDRARDGRPARPRPRRHSRAGPGARLVPPGDRRDHLRRRQASQPAPRGPQGRRPRPRRPLAEGPGIAVTSRSTTESPIAAS